MKKVAIIDKAPSRNRYKEYFEFEFDVFHMSDVPVKKLLKKDITLNISLDEYELVILVGSEAAKEYAKISSVSTMMGQLVNNKFIAIPNPAMLIFKPEGKQDFLRAINRVNSVYQTGKQYVELGDFKGINDTEEALEFLLEIYNANPDIVAFDTETTALYPRDGYVLGISLAYQEDRGRYILTDCLSDECMQILTAIVKRGTVFHNMKFDYKMSAYHLNLEFNRDKVDDTMVMHYFLDENSPHGLKALALKYTDFGDYDSELDAFKKEYCSKYGIKAEDFTYDLIPFDIISKYAAIDACVTLVLYKKFKPILEKNPKINNAYKELGIKSTLFLMDMEEVGIPFDIPRLNIAKEFLDQEIEEVKQAIFSYPEIIQYGQDHDVIFNPNSVYHLRAVLFDYLGLQPTGAKTATGAISTDAEVLEELAQQHPLPALLLKVRRLTKIRSTYIEKVITGINKSGRLHTNFNNTFVTSGRLSSSGKLNAQQFPRDNAIVKGCIKAPPGYKIVSQDLKTGEVYYAAILSGDKALQEVFKLGGDLHSAIAKAVFNLPCDVEDVKQLYPGMRQAAKSITFGILYGASAAKVAQQVTEATGEYYSLEDAEAAIRDYFTKFKTLKKWLDAQKTTIKENGFIYSFFGRKRRLPNVFSSDNAIASHEVRSGINFLIQSVCSDVNLMAAMETQDACDKLNIDAKIFMLVHDSIVALVREDQVKEYEDTVQFYTQIDRGVSIHQFPIGVDTEIGDDYSFGKFDKQYEVRDNKLASLSA